MIVLVIPGGGRELTQRNMISNGEISGMLEAGRRDILGLEDVSYFPQSFHKRIDMKGWPWAGS